MGFERLPETVHTLYAELTDQVIAAEAEAVARGLPPGGSFVSKRVKRNTYWYLQRRLAGRREQHYLGPESEALLAWMERVREARDEQRVDARRRAELVDMLVAGGAAPTPRGPGRVIQALVEAGVFRMGGVLIGTHAYVTSGNLLGIQLRGRHVRTEDVDIASDPRIAVVLDPGGSPADVLAILGETDRRFFGVPGFDPREPSVSFKLRGRDLRVDFLTPQRVRGSEEPVRLERLGVAAQPLEFLGYLLEETTQAVALYDSGVLIQAPDPARFAFHKLWLTGRRPVAQQARARKDLAQAGALLEVLAEDRPRDLEKAWAAMPVKRRRQAEDGLRRLEPALREAVEQAAGIESSR
jgi:hypothetical protein